MLSSEQPGVEPSVAVVERDLADGAVKVLLVVPGYEAGDPGSRRVDALEGTVRAYAHSYLPCGLRFARTPSSSLSIPSGCNTLS